MPKSRQGLSGNPQRRAEQLWERAEHLESRRLAPDTGYAGPAPKPVPWWPESYAKILARVRDSEWPSRQIDVETLAGAILGEEFHARMNTPGVTGLYPSRWLEGLADEAEDALRTEIATDGGDWPRLWAFLCALPGTAIPIKLEFIARQLAERGLTPSISHAFVKWRLTGDALVARDAYGSRFLVVAPFSETKADRQDEPTGSPETGHWYAWDLDWCSMGIVMAAGPHASATDALAEWRDAVGPVAVASELAPCSPDLVLRLLHPALALGTIWEVVEGDEPVELMREYFRLFQRASILAGDLMDRLPEKTEGEAGESEGGDSAVESFLDWYSDRDDAFADSQEQTAEAAECLVGEWGPLWHPDKELFYACSPHRIEATGVLLRDGYEPDYANAALRLLPEWTQWCLTRRPISPEAATRSREAASAQAALLIEENYVANLDEERNPFARQE
jgi:hypothetical protein